MRPQRLQPVFQKSIQLDGIVQQFCVDRCFDGPRSYVVDGDAQWRQLNGKIARQHFYATLTRAIRSEMWEGKLFVHRADVYDLAPSLCLHAMFHKRLGNEKKPF